MNSKVYKLPIIVKHEVRVVEHELVTYVRTRDIADALGIKQPFQFTKDIRVRLGDVVLNGTDTQDFRSPDDNSRTPYVRLSHMIEFLKGGVRKHKTNGTVSEVIDILEQHMNKPTE